MMMGNGGAEQKIALRSDRDVVGIDTKLWRFIITRINPSKIAGWIIDDLHLFLYGFVNGQILWVLALVLGIYDFVSSTEIAVPREYSRVLLSPNLSFHILLIISWDMSLTNGVLTALPAPPGYIVDFDNPQRQSNIATYWIVGVGNALSLLFLAQHLYVNSVVRRKLGLIDGCLVVAWVFIVILQVIVVMSFVEGYNGVHAWEIPLSLYGEFFKYIGFINFIMYTVPTALAKTCILTFFLRLQNTNKWYNWAIFTTMFLNISANISIFFASVFACSPISKAWDISVAGTCINRLPIFEFQAIQGVVLDVLIILIPIPMIFGLRLSKAKKFGLVFMFTVGSATVITSCVRLALLATKLDDADQTWGGGPVNAWICVEANLLIICASLPTLRLFIRTLAPSLLSGSDGSTKPSAYGYGGASGTHGLVTSQSTTKPKRQQYGRFDDTDNEEIHMKTMVEASSPSLDLEMGRAKHSEHDPISGKEWNEDSTSEKGILQSGILQTKTLDVSYAQAEDGNDRRKSITNYGIAS